MRLLLMNVINCRQQNAAKKVQLFWLRFYQRDLIIIIVIIIIIIYFRS